MTLPPEQLKKKKEQERFAYISELSFQSWQSGQGIL